jgi:hypothetical protein
MKKSTLALALGVFALSGGICAAQEPAGRMANPVSRVPSLQCCQCVKGKIVVPPPLDISTGHVPWTVSPGGPQGYVITSPNSGWANLSPAQWIQSVSSPTPGAAGAGPFHYATAFNVPKCAIPFSSVQLNGTYAADNGAVVTLSPNTSTCSGPLTYPFCFKTPGMPLNFPVSLTTPLQTLNVDVTNQPQTISGLAVKATLTARCPVCPPTSVDIPNLPMQGGNENTPCPVLGQVFTRAQVQALPATSYVHIMLPNLDLQCASKGPGFTMQKIVFLTCSPDPRGPGFGPNATATLTCGP